MKTLHLVLKSKWYDKIASGEKTSEYRECKPYWNKRFIKGDPLANSGFLPRRLPFMSPYKYVVFHKGYTSETMKFEIAALWLLHYVKNDLNSNHCWEIKLGKRIK